MIEWIVLVWVAPCWPVSSFKCDGSDRITRVSISSTTAQFEQKWNSLSGKELETARVFRGKEAIPKTILESESGKTFEQLADEAAEETNKKLAAEECEYLDHKPDNLVTRYWPPDSKIEISICLHCGKRIKKTTAYGFWSIDK